MKQKYNAGDIVKVADFKNCVFGVHPSMRRYIGQEVRIIDVIWRGSYGAHQYVIAEDGREWWWDQQCFESLNCEELPEFEAASSLDLLLF